MKRNNPLTNSPFKRGDVREDGYIFDHFNTTRIRRDGFFEEVWLSEQTFKNVAIRKAKWKKANPEQVKFNHSKYREKHKLNLRKKGLEYIKQNPDKHCANQAKRRASKLKATPAWLTIEQIQQIKTIYSECRQLTKTTGIKHHVDHIIPLKNKFVCGLHVPANLQILSAEDNLKKNNKFSSCNFL